MSYKKSVAQKMQMQYTSILYATTPLSEPPLVE